MYDFKKLPELGFFVLVAVVIAAAQILFVFQPDQIGNWRLWAVALAGAVVRAAAGAILTWLGMQGISVQRTPPPTPPAP